MHRKICFIILCLVILTFSGCFLFSRIEVIVNPNYDPSLPIQIVVPQDQYGGEIASRVRHRLMAAGYTIVAEGDDIYELHFSYSITRDMLGTPEVHSFSAELHDTATGEIVLSARKYGMKDDLHSVIDNFVDEFIAATR